MLLSARKEVNQNKMLKITIEVSENKDQETCKAVLKNPKETELKKATEQEKQTMAMVINKVTDALHELED